MGSSLVPPESLRGRPSFLACDWVVTGELKVSRLQAIAHTPIVAKVTNRILVSSSTFLTILLKMASR